MSSATTAIGVIILIMGIITMAGWIYEYNEISSALSLMQTGEQTLEQISMFGGLIPIIGGGISQTTGSVAALIEQVRMTITMFFIYNMMLGFALVLNGIALISIGKKGNYLDNRISKFRDHLLKNKDKKK